jgi:hypothetical protein
MTIENIFDETIIIVESNDNAQQIYVSATAPDNPNVNDLWIQI